jgi:Tfp pilus assembly protein PilN
MLVIAAFSLIVFLSWMNEYSVENEQLVAKIQEHEAAIKQLKGEGEKIQQQMTPDQRAVLSAAHRLVANKQFGWSRLFADLESVLPGSVSASRIVVQNIYNDGGRVKAEIEMGVLSRDYASLNAMIQNMQNSGHFQAELRGQDYQKTDRMTYTEYTLRVIYSPSYVATSAPTTDVAQTVPGGVQ